MIPKSRAYKKCVELMKCVAERGLTNQVHQKVLEVVITQVIGQDPRTRKNWIATLERLGFIHRLNPLVYQMNAKDVPELLNVLVKRGQKKLM